MAHAALALDAADDLTMISNFSHHTENTEPTHTILCEPIAATRTRG